jgi:hypothetical protein
MDNKGLGLQKALEDLRSGRAVEEYKKLDWEMKLLLADSEDDLRIEEEPPEIEELPGSLPVTTKGKHEVDLALEWYGLPEEEQPEREELLKSLGIKPHADLNETINAMVGRVLEAAASGHPRPIEVLNDDPRFAPFAKRSSGEGRGIMPLPVPERVPLAIRRAAESAREFDMGDSLAGQFLSAYVSGSENRLRAIARELVEA